MSENGFLRIHPIGVPLEIHWAEMPGKDEQLGKAF